MLLIFTPLPCDESTDAPDTAQLQIFLWGVDENFGITEELLDLKSLKGTTTDKDIFFTCGGIQILFFFSF